MAEKEGPGAVGTVLRPRLADADAGGISSYEVVIEEGPDRGRTVTLDGLTSGRVFVGTSEACQLRLADPTVSRRHLAITAAGISLRVTDLESTNGTRVEGVRVLDALLSPGQLVRIGATAFRFETHNGATVAPVAAATGFGRMVGESPAMRRLYPLCARLAATDVLVVIEGETGTGKEVLAESIHEQGPRAAGPFVVFDCTAVPPNLVEAELFGHEKGAFTGAVGARKGVFEQAHGGTLLIDEIGDLELSLQPKLLRIIERGEVRRLAGTQAIRVDVRILAATRRDLDREVQAGRFRDDLFHRLAVARLDLPPLRERDGDVERLAQHFFAQLSGGAVVPSSSLLARWRDYPWPGNVRELRNAVARQIALGDLAEADAEGAPTGVRSTEHGGGVPDIVEEVIARKLPWTLARQRVIDAFERRYVEAVLDQHGGNVLRAAASSGIARRYLHKLKARQIPK